MSKLPRSTENNLAIKSETERNSGSVPASSGLALGISTWHRLGGRKFSIGTALTLLVISSSVACSAVPEGSDLPNAAAVPPVTFSESPSPTATPASISDYIGEVCDGDELVMEQGTETLYCDEGAIGSYVWFTQTKHDENILAAKKIAEEKVAEEKAAKIKAEAEKKAAIEKQDASEKLASEKKAAEKDASKKAEQKRVTPQKDSTGTTEQPVRKKPTPTPEKAPSSAYYKNCSAVRAAGAAPIYKGDPGYSRKLDRDGDGVGCE